jgi:hypothetical protein
VARELGDSVSERKLKDALQRIAYVSPNDLESPASVELWAAKAKDAMRIADEALLAHDAERHSGKWVYVTLEVERYEKLCCLLGDVQNILDSAKRQRGEHP